MPRPATPHPSAITGPPVQDRPSAKRRSRGVGGMRRPYDPPERSGPRSRWYLTTRTRFFVAFATATTWLGLSVWISLPWIYDLAAHITVVPAVVVISLIAFVPGHLIAFLGA